jgi:type I restriction enzyme S subunit
MEEWKEYRLGDCLEALIDYRGKTPKKTSFGIPLITAKIIKNGQIEPPTEYIAEKDYDLWMVRGLPKEGDVVLTTEAPLGEVAQLGNQKIALAQRVVTMRGKKDFLNNTYLKYFFLSNEGQGRLRARETGTTVTGIKQSELREVKITCPPYEIQKKIANILSSLDDKIELNRKINSNLEEQAKALYSKYASLAIGTARIGDLANEVLDYTPCTYPRVYLLNSSDISEGIFPKIELVDNKDLKGHFKKRFRFGDILYSQIRPRNHHYGLVLFEADRYISSTRLMIIRTKKEQISEYLLYQAIISPCVCDEFTLKTETRSGTFPQGNYKDMANIIIPYGTKEQREKIEPKLKVLRKAIYSYQKENVILSSIRDALLPKLMSGEIEVK